MSSVMKATWKSKKKILDPKTKAIGLKKMALRREREKVLLKLNY